MTEKWPLTPRPDPAAPAADRSGGIPRTASPSVPPARRSSRRRGTGLPASLYECGSAGGPPGRGRAQARRDHRHHPPGMGVGSLKPPGPRSVPSLARPKPNPVRARAERGEILARPADPERLSAARARGRARPGARRPTLSGLRLHRPARAGPRPRRRRLGFGRSLLVRTTKRRIVA